MVIRPVAQIEGVQPIAHAPHKVCYGQAPHRKRGRSCALPGSDDEHGARGRQRTIITRNGVLVEKAARAVAMMISASHQSNARHNAWTRLSLDPTIARAAPSRH